MRRWIIFSVSVAAMTLVAACADANDETASAPQEPSEFAAHVVDLATSGEWEELQDLMVDDFADFEEETIARGISIDMFPDHATEPESWHVEEHDAFTVVRMDDWGAAAIVLRPGEDDWLYDPGQYRYLRFTMHEEGLTREGQLVPWQLDMESEDNVLARRILNVSVDQIGVDDGLDVTLQIGPSVAETIEIESIYWLVEGEEIPTDVSWSTAALNDVDLSFPQVGDGALYYVTFHLEAISDVDEVELVMDDIVASGVEGDPERSFEMVVRLGIPVEEYPELVEAE